MRDKILVVDDNIDNVKLLQSVLDSKYDVVTTISSKEIFSLVQKYDFDLVLLDLIMPVINGFEVCKYLKADEKTKDVPVIFLTGKTDTKSILEGFEVGGVDYITKPFQLNELLARIKTHIKLRKLSKNLENLVKERTKELELKSQELERKLVTDGLTGLKNRAKLLEVLNNSNSIKTLIFLNIDNFTQVNTTYGYQIGNDSLVAISEYLDSKKANGELFRFASDEFVFLFDDMSQEQAKEFAKDLNKSIYNDNLIVKSTIKLHISFTIAISIGDTNDLLKKAHLALQEARLYGKNRYVIYNDDMEVVKKQENNIYWMNKVKISLEKDMIIPFFQGIVDNSTGEIVRYEVLARIKDNDKIISPFFFIEPARAVGLITDITKSIIRKSFAVFSSNNYSFSINITNEDLEEEYLKDMLKALSLKYSIAPSRVILEVLEDVSVYGSQASIKQLEALKQEGFLIALDDFGSEHANFSRIMDLQVDIIKIDGRFIKNIDTDTKSQLIVESIVYMAKKLGSKSVAEFVHSQSVQEVVKALDIDYSQGYFFHMPNEAIS